MSSGRLRLATHISDRTRIPSTAGLGGLAGSRRVAAPAGPRFLSLARLWRGAPGSAFASIAAPNLGDLAALKHHLQEGARLFGPAFQEWPIALDAFHGLLGGFRRAFNVNLAHGPEDLSTLVPELEIAGKAVLCKPLERSLKDALIDVGKCRGIHDRIFYPTLDARFNRPGQ